MTKLYRLKDRAVREVGKDDEVRLRCLLRAGFEKGDLPPLPKPKPSVEEKPLPPTEGEDADALSEGEVVLAEHEPVATPSVPLQEVKDEEAEVDDADTEDAEEAVAEDAPELVYADDATELSEGDGELPEVTVTVDGEEIEGTVEETTEAEDEPEGKDEDGEAGGTDEPTEESEEEDG